MTVGSTSWILLAAPPQVPVKRLQIPSNKDNDALNGGASGGVGEGLGLGFKKQGFIAGFQSSFKWLQALVSRTDKVQTMSSSL